MAMRMTVAELFVPATITSVDTIDPGEIRCVTLTLPETYELEGRPVPIRDRMRPGNAFLTRPMGARSGKPRRRMYTRSNCAALSPWALETIINHTHEERADTSIWWQTDEVAALHQQGGSVDVRVTISGDGGELVLFENSLTPQPGNLRLEEDAEWPRMRMVAIALSTGITPFLAYVRYMASLEFGRTAEAAGCHFTLIASARTPRQLLQHDELLALAARYPDNFRYWPVLTRSWPEDWPYGKGRILQLREACEGEAVVDPERLFRIVPDLTGAHLRFCGNAACRDQLLTALQQQGITLASTRAEVW